MDERCGLGVYVEDGTVVVGECVVAPAFGQRYVVHWWFCGIGPHSLQTGGDRRTPCTPPTMRHTCKSSPGSLTLRLRFVRSVSTAWPWLARILARTWDSGLDLALLPVRSSAFFFLPLCASAVVKAHYSRADSALPRSPPGPLYITSLTLASGSQWLRTAHSTNPMFTQHRGLPCTPRGDMGTVAWSGATARFWYSLASVSVSKE